MKFIKFTLSAPLQSWGEDARWDQRTTATMPPKSAIIGLLGCCLGIPRGSDQLRHMGSHLNMAVRADRPGRIMTDYQTVQGTNGVFLNADGKPRGGGDTIITPKQYLQEARFTVFLWGDDGLLTACYKAMLHPRWAVYLGRKSCTPSIPVMPQWITASTPEEAVSCFTEEELKFSDPIVQVEMDAGPNDTPGKGQRLVTRRDAVSRADLNEYGIRWVRSFAVPAGGEKSCT